MHFQSKVEIPISTSHQHYVLSTILNVCKMDLMGERTDRIGVINAHHCLLFLRSAIRFP